MISRRNSPQYLADLELVRQIQQAGEDYAWFHSQANLLDRYQGKVVFLHGRVVVGSGQDSEEALANVRQRAIEEQRAAPPYHEMLLIVVPEKDCYPNAWLWIDPQSPETQIN